MTARKTDDELAVRIRERRESMNLTVRELAKLLGKYPSYISLVENGAKVPSERTARRLAQILEDDEDLYAAWAAAHQGDNIQTILESARRYEVLHRSPRIRMEVIGPDEVSFEPSPEPSLSLGSAARMVSESVDFLALRSASPMFSEPSDDREFARIPVFTEGADPGDGPESGEEVVDYLRLDAARIPDEERLVRPFAYRLSQRGVRDVDDLLQAGDCVVITRAGAPPVSNEIYAVRREGGVVLSRVLRKGDSLLLLSSRGPEAIDILHLRGGRLESFIVGRVAVIIRPWQFALFSPSQASRRE